MQPQQVVGHMHCVARTFGHRLLLMLVLLTRLLAFARTYGHNKHKRGARANLATYHMYCRCSRMHVCLNVCACVCLCTCVVACFDSYMIARMHVCISLLCKHISQRPCIAHVSTRCACKSCVCPHTIVTRLPYITTVFAQAGPPHNIWILGHDREV